ncbi:MAG: oligopeptidase A, partial [Gammaproteobacteria bacterium]
MDNPLLKDWPLPPFSAIRPEHIEPALDRVLAENRRALEGLLAQDHYTWENLVTPLEAMGERLNRLWSPVRHLHAVADSEPLRKAYQACLAKLSAYATEIGQNERLYRAYLAIAEGPEYDRLTPAQRKVIDDALRDFRLAGVHLPEQEKARYKAIQQELSELANRFETNVLDATHRWQKHVTDEKRLSGLPESARALLKQNAERKGLSGWLITLDFPSYHAVMTYADDRALRREVYEAYVTRAADVGPHDRALDNTRIMERILALRHELARITGFAHFAERSLATKMAADPHQVLDFLKDLA